MTSHPMNLRFPVASISARRFLLSCVSSLLLASLAAIAAIAQVNAQQPKGEGSSRSEARAQSIVRGRVIYEDTRRPLRRVWVTIYDPAGRGRGNMMAWTDGRGEFQFKNVPAGKYFIQVEAPGIIRAEPFDAGEYQKDLTTVIVDGTSKSEVTVRVKRGGAVSGKVTYADGDPVVNASIKVLRRKDSKWVPVYVGGRTSDRADTDERGIYRISGLAPGEYLIGAAEEKMGVELMAQELPDFGNALNRSLLSTTYYDGATSLSGATPLQIVAGDEKTDINITLADQPLHSISGIVTFKTDNRPVTRARISIKRKDAELDGPYFSEEPVVNTDEQGRFIFDEVLEGTYTISISPLRQMPNRYSDGQPASQADPTRKFAAKRFELNVTGSDLTNLEIEVSSGGRISGVMTVDGDRPLPRNVLVFLDPATGERRDLIPAQVQRDGTFIVEGIPSGGYYLRTSVQPNNTYYTKSVMHGRTDLTREPLNVKEGEDISNVRMVISPDRAQLSGRILAPDGKSPARGVNILFVPADPAEQKALSKRMYGWTNADGGFSVSGAPGEYMAIVMRPGEDFFQLRGDALRLRASVAPRVTLQAGENSKLELVVPGDK